MVAATRIHNRHLRTQFGRHWQPGDTFEYLFFADPAGALVGEPVLCIPIASNAGAGIFSCVQPCIWTNHWAAVRQPHRLLNSIT